MKRQEMMTASADLAPAVSLAESDGESDSGRPTARERRGDWFLAVIAAVMAGVATFLRFGYFYDTGDQAVLAPAGVAAANPDALVNDWFTRDAPQPHWSFDLVTYLGESAGVRPTLYLVYWLVAFAAFGFATAWIARRWLPDRARWLAALVGPVVVLGPVAAAGSTSPLLGMALPHVLGGCLAYLALSCLVTERRYLVSLFALLAAVAHVQHGANLAVVIASAALLAKGWPRRARVLMGASAAAIAVMAVVVTQARGIVSSGDDFVQICDRVIPYHCDANSWSKSVLAQAALIGILIAGLVASRWRREWRRVAPALGLPAVGLMLGIAVDVLDIPVLGELAQRVNIYRLVTLLVPYMAWAILGGVVFAFKKTAARIAALAVTGVAGWLWLAGPSAALSDGLETGPGWAAIVVAAVLTAGVAFAAWGRPRLPASLAWAPAAALIAGVVAISPALALRDFSSTMPSSPVAYRIGQSVEKATEPGAVIVANPASSWLRMYSLRAVIADNKAVPYGGPPWVEYQERMSALTRSDALPASAGSYETLTLDDIEGLKTAYGATHVLFATEDPRALDAEDAGWKAVLKPRATMPAWLFAIP